MKVALYSRVSTRDKEQNPEMQLNSMRKYCAENNLEIFKEFTDYASARDWVGRKQWTALMKDASLHKFDLLLIWKLDRGWRDIGDANDSLKIFESYHIDLRSQTENIIDTTTPFGKLLFSLFAMLAEFERGTLIERVNEGIKFAREHGTKSGKPFGRPAVSIPIQSVCSAVYSAKGNYSKAARILSELYKKKITQGFVSLRLKRAKIDKNAIIQTPALFFKSSQSHFE